MQNKIAMLDQQFSAAVHEVEHDIELFKKECDFERDQINLEV